MKPLRKKVLNFLSPARGFHVFAILFLLAYGVVPTAYWIAGYGDIYFLLLAVLTAVSLVTMLLSYYMPFPDFFIRDMRRLRVPPSLVKLWIPLIFFCFITYTLATAQSIPIFSALSGVVAELLSEERGAFLKGRSGMELSLLYISTILVNTLVPYSLVVLFALKHKLRFFVFLAFFFYALSFLQKTLFLNVLMPLLVFYSGKSKIYEGDMVKFVLLVAGLLLVLISITYEGSSAGEGAKFLSAQYLPSGAMDFLLWRAIAVPIFTATDTLVVHEVWFRGDHLLGATSSFFAQIFGIERLNIERHVFEYQFGGWNEIANANAVFFLDGYVNFGVVGVIVYSFIVGQFFRIFAKTKDEALSALWIIFANGAYAGSLIGLLLSNGFILIFTYALFFRNREIELLDEKYKR
jgi:hypothetical protein